MIEGKLVLLVTGLFRTMHWNWKGKPNPTSKDDKHPGGPASVYAQKQDANQILEQCFCIEVLETNWSTSDETLLSKWKPCCFEPLDPRLHPPFSVEHLIRILDATFRVGWRLGWRQGNQSNFRKERHEVANSNSILAIRVHFASREHCLEAVGPKLKRAESVWITDSFNNWWP